MNHFVRNVFPYLFAAMFVGAIAWAFSFEKLPQGDFTFNNEEEVKSVDPVKAVGVPEHRVLSAVYEGLLNLLPADAPPMPPLVERSFGTRAACIVEVQPLEPIKSETRNKCEIRRDSKIIKGKIMAFRHMILPL